MTRLVWRTAWIILSLTLLAAAITVYLLRPKPPPRLTLAPAGYNEFAGWGEDGVSAALPALLRSCAAFSPKPTARLTP